jgi:hypothetical protein
MQVNIIATQPANSLPLGQRQRGTETLSAPLSALNITILIVVGLVVALAIVIPIYARLPKHWRRPLNSRPHHSVPCHGCRYLNNNPHLKCALHPATALTKQALDCGDYCPNSPTK